MAEETLVNICVVGVEEKGKVFPTAPALATRQTTFTIEVSNAARVWQVRRELSEIQALFETLRKKYPTVPTLPAASVLNLKSKDEKKLLVNDWFTTCSRHSQLGDSHEWATFLVSTFRELFGTPKGEGVDHTVDSVATTTTPAVIEKAEEKKKEAAAPTTAIEEYHSPTDAKGSNSLSMFESLITPVLIALTQQSQQFTQAITDQQQAYVGQNEKILQALTQQRTDFLASLRELPASGVGGPAVAVSSTPAVVAAKKIDVSTHFDAVLEFEKAEVQPWKCKQHAMGAHDIFINYRVRTDKDCAEKIFLYLSGQRKADGSPVSVFFDKYCLQDGEDWEVGFLQGLQGASLIVLLISEDGIQQIRESDQRQDNVLLEYEYALDKYERGEALVFPMLLGKEEKAGHLKKFAAFDASVFPDGPHLSRKSNKNVRETMSRLFKLQGSQTDPSSFVFNMPALMRVLDRADSKKTASQISRILQAFAKTKGRPNCNTEDIQEILNKANMSIYCDLFATNKVDGNILAAMFSHDTSQQSSMLRHLRIFLMKNLSEQKEKSPKDEFLAYIRSLPSGIAAKDCYDKISEGIRKFHDDAAVQVETLQAIAMMTESQQENRLEIITRGGAELVIETVQNFPKDASVLETGFNAMVNLMLAVLESIEYEGFNEKSAAVIFVRKGGIAVVVTGLQKYPNSLPLVKAGLLALFYLSMNAANCKSIIEHGGLRVVLGIMKNLFDLQVLQETGINVLANLAANSPPEVNKLIGESGAITAITDALAKYKTIPLLSSVCALSCIAEYPSNRSIIASSGWLLRAFELLNQEQKSISQLHLFTARLIGKLVKDTEENQKKCLEEKTVALVMKDLGNWLPFLPVPEKLQTSGDVATETLDLPKTILIEKTISELLYIVLDLLSFPETIQELMSLNGPELFIALLKRFIDDEDEEEDGKGDDEATILEDRYRSMEVSKGEISFYCDTNRKEIRHKLCMILASFLEDPSSKIVVGKLRDLNPGLITIPTAAQWWFCESCKTVEFSPDTTDLLGTLKSLDVDGDGSLDATELARAVQLTRPEKRSVCTICKRKTKIRSSRVLIEASEFQYTLKKMEERAVAKQDGKPPYQISVCVCENEFCNRIEFPGCDHGVLSVQETENSVRCHECLSSTYNTAPWRIGCRWCQSPFIARACILRDKTSLKELRRH